MRAVGGDKSDMENRMPLLYIYLSYRWGMQDMITMGGIWYTFPYLPEPDSPFSTTGKP